MHAQESTDMMIEEFRILFTPRERTWRLKLKRPLRTKREYTELRLALYCLDGLRFADKERFVVDGEELVVSATNPALALFRLAAPNIALTTELLTPDIPAFTRTKEELTHAER
jgi:hypothetical protein